MKEIIVTDTDKKPWSAPTITELKVDDTECIKKGNECDGFLFGS